MSLHIGNSKNSANLISGSAGLLPENLNMRYAFIFKGYIMSSTPTTSEEDDLWIESDSLPTSFPVNIKSYRGGSWTGAGTYAPLMYDLWIYKDSSNNYYSCYWDSNSTSWIPLDNDFKYIPLAGTEESRPVTGMIRTDNDKGGIWGTIGTSDAYRFIGRNDDTQGSKNFGYLEIATTNNNNGSIYVRQYDSENASLDLGNSEGNFSTLKRSLILLDEVGDTKVPERLSVSYNKDTKLVMGSGINYDGYTDQYSWIDHRNSADDKILTNLLFLNSGEIVVKHSKLGLGGTMKTEDSKRTCIPIVVMQWNEEEKCVEFIFT